MQCLLLARALAGCLPSVPSACCSTVGRARCLDPGFGIGVPKKKPSGSESESEEDEQVGHQVSSCSCTGFSSPVPAPSSPSEKSMISADASKAVERQLLEWRSPTCCQGSCCGVSSWMELCSAPRGSGESTCCSTSSC